MLGCMSHPLVEMRGLARIFTESQGESLHQLLFSFLAGQLAVLSCFRPSIAASRPLPSASLARLSGDCYPRSVPHLGIYGQPTASISSSSVFGNLICPFAAASNCCFTFNAISCHLFAASVAALCRRKVAVSLFERPVLCFNWLPSEVRGCWLLPCHFRLDLFCVRQVSILCLFESSIFCHCEIFRWGPLCGWPIGSHDEGVTFAVFIVL